MQLQRLHLNQFSAFEEAEFEFCPGINVLIGANSTGKSHVMKAAYSLLEVCRNAHLFEVNSREQVESNLTAKLLGVFKPDSVGRLVRRKRGKHAGCVEIIYNERVLKVDITSGGKVAVDYGKLPNPESSVYLPTHEFLSIQEGFIGAWRNRETAYDETYYDLSLALDSKPLRGPRLEEIRKLVDPLKKVISGSVTQEDGRFYVGLPEGKLEAHLVAEGYRKLAGLMYLILNGSLTQNGILFWDEPEANLNPNLTMVVVEVLRVLADSGVQTFVATHDYLLSQELSLLAEYPSNTQVQFFSLYRESRTKGVKVESGNTLVDIEHNPILDEFAAHYDREAKLFKEVE